MSITVQQQEFVNKNIDKKKYVNTTWISMFCFSGIVPFLYLVYIKGMKQMMFKKTQRILSYLVVASIAVLPSSVFSAESSLPYPKEAQIIHYPQIHRPKEAPPDSGLDFNKDLIHAAAQSQFRLLQILRDDPGLKVFGEGFTSDFDKESIIDRQKNRGLRNFEDRVLSAFKDGLPKNIKTSTPEQVKLLGIVSDGMEIALILDYVDKIYKAEDLEVHKKAIATIKDSDKDNHHKKVYDERERILKTEIEKNSKEGDRVLIVYGIAHELSYLFDTIYRIPAEIGSSMDAARVKRAFALWIDRLIDLRKKGHLLKKVHWKENGSLKSSHELFEQFAKHPKKERFEVIAGLKNAVRQFKESVFRRDHKAQNKLGDNKEAVEKISACPPQFNKGL